MVEWLEHLAVVRNVAGASSAWVEDWKTLTVHPAVNFNGYLINYREG